MTQEAADSQEQWEPFKELDQLIISHPKAGVYIWIMKLYISVQAT